jgi:cholest-4-en-3-one 26-monooxygenase
MGDRPNINLLDDEAFETDEPDTWFRWLRANAPVYWHDEPEAPGFWVLSKHADVVEVNRNSQVFSSDAKYGGVVPFEDAKMASVNEFAADIPLMLTMDDPDHARYRKLVNRGFTPRSLARVEERLRGIAKELVDDALSQGTCDWVETVAAWLPITAITELVGVPAEDRRKVFDWANQTAGATDPEFGGDLSGMVATMMEVFAYSAELQEDRRARPAEDIMTTLVQADVDGEELNELEITMFFFLLLNAGSETTRNSISHALTVMMEQPDIYRELAADRSLLPGAIEEMIRWGTPVTYMRRTAIADTKIRGQTIKNGDKVTIWYGSANRDDEVFKDPYRFDIRRNPNPHVGFGGGGAHFCLGANLARMEIRVLFDELLDRVQEFKPAGPPERLRSNMINGIKHLPVELVPAP